MSNYKKLIEQNRKNLIENYFNSLNSKEINLKNELVVYYVENVF